jgi:hypothetical protein
MYLHTGYSEAGNGEDMVVFDDKSVSALLGELNTEAKCVALLFTPQEPTRVSDISESLVDAGAYDIEERSRFNVSGILGQMPDLLVKTSSKDEESGNSQPRMWAQKSKGYFGEFIDGVSGTLLDYSLRHDRPLRTIIGEKKQQKGITSAIELRLGVLAAVAKLSHESGYGTIDRNDVIDCVEEAFKADSIPLIRDTVLKAIGRLQVDGVVEIKTVGIKSDVRLFDTEKARPTEEQVMDLLGIVGKIATADREMVFDGQTLRNKIISRRSTIANLIHTSYSSSNHTGKASR